MLLTQEAILILILALNQRAQWTILLISAALLLPQNWSISSIKVDKSRKYNSTCLSWKIVVLRWRQSASCLFHYNAIIVIFKHELHDILYMLGRQIPFRILSSFEMLICWMQFLFTSSKILPTILESVHSLTKEERIFEIFGHTLPKTIFWLH